jgi:mannose-6-phosphate isomerase-like protein (cupin superfamily)
MKTFIKAIENQAENNTAFRKVLVTGQHTQVVIMNLKPSEDIGEEVHPDNDQIIYVVEGNAQIMINDEIEDFEEEDLVLIPAGAKHNVINKGKESLKLITTYSPPHHPDGTIHQTKADAEKAESKEK